jgi:hypothetical protein
MSANPDPWPLFDIELDLGRVDEVELALGVYDVEIAIPAVCRRAVGADFDDRDTIEHAPYSYRACLESLDHQPGLGV